MACNLTSTKASACASGIGKEANPIILLQLIAQLTCEIAAAGGGTGTTQVYIYTTATPNGEITPTATGQPALAYKESGGPVFWWDVTNQVWH